MVELGQADTRRGNPPTLRVTHDEYRNPNDKERQESANDINDIKRHVLANLGNRHAERTQTGTVICPDTR